MGDEGTAVQPSKGMMWGGWIMTGIPGALLALSGAAKVAQLEQVMTSLTEFGYPEGLVLVIGIVELVCAGLYLVPKTSVLGAILVTGYLGGATATHVRIEDPGFVVPVLLGVLAWGGLFLRDARIRRLLPLRD